MFSVLFPFSVSLKYSVPERLYSPLTGKKFEICCLSVYFACCCHSWLCTSQAISVTGIFITQPHCTATEILLRSQWMHVKGTF